MTLHQLKVFVAVAKLGSFTQASHTLHISQPSLSSVVSGLARELGAKLFERLGNKMHLTAVGERVLRSAEEALSKVEGIKGEIDDVQGLKKGTIRVGGSSLAGATFLPEAVQKFRNKHPGADVILKIQGSGSLEKGLLEGDLDLAILGWAPRSPLIAAEPYRQEQVVVIASPNHLLTKKRSVSLELLAKEPLITYSKGSLLRAMVEQSFLQNGLPFLPRLEFDVNFGCRDAIKRAVAKGLGIGFHSRCHVASDIEAGRLKPINVPQLQLKRTAYIAYHRRRHHSSFAQAFVAALRDLRPRIHSETQKV